MVELTENSPKNGFREPSFLLAMTMLAGFLLIIAGNSSNLESVKILSGVFGGWIGTIMGYYFGQRPVKGLTDRVEDLTATQTSTIQKFEDAEKDLLKAKEETAKERARFKRTYESLRELYEITRKEKTK